MIPRGALPTVESILFAFVLAAVVVRVATFFVHRALGGLDVVSAENRAALQARERQLRLALRLAAFGVAAIASLSLALERFGVAEPRWRPAEIAQWFLTHGINIIVIVALAFIVIRAANLAIEHLRYKVDRGHGGADLEWQRRAATLGGLLSSLVTALVVFAALLMLLRELAIDVLPILTGAGIAGLAVGFGAQNLVRDVISGFFMILEDQVRVGDAARINGVAGTVEQINLRTVVLRDGDGAVQVFPNGTIATLANLSKHFAYAVVSVRVAYSESVDRAIGLMRDVGESMGRDGAWGGVMLEPANVLGVESLADGFATITMKVKVLPLNQGRVANEMRKRLLTAFVRAGIKPYAGG